MTIVLTARWPCFQRELADVTISEPQNQEAAKAAELREFAETFHAWLPEWFEITLATRREGDRWFALAEEFDITGMGNSEQAAKRDMLGLLAVYLVSHFEEGHAFETTWRPIPVRLKMVIRRDQMVNRAIRLLRRPAGRETHLLVPSDALQPSRAIC